ncbi:MBL fold metallo-hydrolase [Cohnella zeiphila]|uniref:beta-lactamase n=1 Tax=Cohnella zeiphila TaxID=2761120 RepID=A0A7X0VT68_9BACL|nr:MBL fold metallo-hydrolase [Cohnella zeiphila]MBB6729606.1 MBL fold metallo-hydrolase [Cohnella zeiphila]
MRLLRDVYLTASGKLGYDATHPADCNAYLVDAGASLVLIDAGTGLSADALLDNVAVCGFEPGRVSHLLLTHLHADHSGGAAAIRRATGASVALPREAAAALEGGEEERIDLPKAVAAGFYPPDYRWEACRVDLPLDDGQTLRIGRYDVSVLHTPGHSASDTSYLFDAGDGSPFLFSGDTVFTGGKISMLSTHDFHLQQLASSISRLAALPFRALLPGHGPAALDNGPSHVRSADRVFARLGVPSSIG